MSFKAAPSIFNAQMKMRRAKIHFDHFNALVTPHLAEPYAIIRKDDLDNAVHIAHVELKPSDIDIAMLVGEIAYAMRSALDQLAWQLSLLTTRKPTRDCEFPIHAEDTRFWEDKFRAKVWDIPWDAIQIIRKLQPYNRGKAFKEDPLWQLSHLCNIDKHRTIAVNGTEISLHIINGPSGFQRRDFHYHCEIVVPLAEKDQLKLNPHSPVMILGEPMDTVETPFEMPLERLGEIYKIVNDDVIPQFAGFFQ